MRERRGVYFAFQGLLMTVLLLLFVYHNQAVTSWTQRFFFLLAGLGGSLAFIRLASDRLLAAWWVQMGLFVFDASLASLTLHWTGGKIEFYLLYIMIIFGTALTRSFVRSLGVAVVLSVLYFLSHWDPRVDVWADTGFLLRLNFLWILTALLTILSRDTQQAQKEQSRAYQQRLIELESLATLGQMAGEVAHRIKGPLTTIRVNAEVISVSRATPESAKRELREIQEEVEHCKSILKDLLDLGRIEEADHEELDLREPLKSALSSVRSLLRENGIEPRISGLEEPMPVLGDRSLLHEAFLAILHNAIEASASAEPKSVRISARTSGGGLAWSYPWRRPLAHEVRVRDHGAGMTPKTLENLFRPFYTEKPGEGTGLGLSAALHILQKHGGSIEAESDGPGTGSTLIVRVPSRPQTPPGRA